MKKVILAITAITALAACSKTSNTPLATAPGYISTYAGNGVYGFNGDGGAATNAQLNFPQGVATDHSGNVYIADASNNRVRMVSAGGIITTIAGTGTAGFAGDGGPATAANLSFPTSVAVDANGNVYIADEGNSVVRMVTSSGTITTFAGNDTSRFSGDNGPATGASLSLPTGLAFDGSGNLYIADKGNQRVRQVNTSGIIKTVAGSGLGTGTPTGGYSGDGGAAISAELNVPSGIAFDASGNMYIADQNNNRVRMVNSAGIISTTAGNGTAGFGGDSSAATSAELYTPVSVAVDGSGNVYISDSYNQRIRVVNTAGVINTYAGNGDDIASKVPVGSYGGDDGPAQQAMLFNPMGIATDPSGNLYIADMQNSRIRKVNK